MVLICLAANVIGAWRLSEALRRRVEYGESDTKRWAEEFNEASGKPNSHWPFTAAIDATGKWMRRIKALSVLLAGLLLVIGATINSWG